MCYLNLLTFVFFKAAKSTTINFFYFVMIFFNDLKLIAFNTYYITIMALFKFFHLTEKAQIFLLYLILEVTHLSIVELVCFYAMWQFVR